MEKLTVGLILLVKILTCACSVTFDSAVVSHVNIPKVFVNYEKSENRRSKRSHTDFFPIRIGIHMADMEEKHSERLKIIVGKAATRISQVLSVTPVDGPLILERTTCATYWTQGPNKGKCSSLRNVKGGEFCENKLDSFVIPDMHLEGLDVFTFNETIPQHSLIPGNGTDADYILYVTSHQSKWCQQENIQGYSSYCRLDQFNRPVAGFINFCPRILINKRYREYDLVKVATHEIFHALGFSKDLFPLFKGCPIDEEDCQPTKKILIEDVHSTPRLRFPSVITQTRAHFNCHKADFGAPLLMVNGTYSSHWDPLLLYGSIMTPDVANLDFAFIDPLTLSVFQDTGWYYVNYDKGDQYTFGKNGGCMFGLTDNCEGSELCNVNDDKQKVGCDFMHFAPAKCERINPARKCGIYKPSYKHDCRKKNRKTIGKHDTRPLRCLAIEEKKKVKAMCTVISCESESDISVLLKGKWISCPLDGKVDVGIKKIICPQRNVFCHDTGLDTHNFPVDTDSAVPPNVMDLVPALGVFIFGMMLNSVSN